MVKTEEQLTSEDRQALALMEEEKQNQVRCACHLLNRVGGLTTMTSNRMDYLTRLGVLWTNLVFLPKASAR